MQRALLSLGIAGALSLPAAVNAQTPAAPASPHTFTGNLTFVSDYRFRGISQTYKDPAIQGGFDYSHATGLYLGTWASNVSGNSYPGGNGMEWDFYGGYKASFGDFGLDVGLLYYWYPSARLPHGPSGSGGNEKFDNLEIYLGGSWKWLTLKYSHTLTDYFGVQNSTFGGLCNRDGVDCFDPTPGDSKGSGYLDLSAAYPIMDKLTLNAHVGRQKVRGYDKLDYTDWKVGLTYDLNGWLLGAAYVDTNADDKWWFIGGSKGIRELGKSTVVVSVGKTF